MQDALLHRAVGAASLSRAICTKASLHRPNTPELRTRLDLLPPHQILQRVYEETIRYVYADPDVCGCLYVGSQQAYDLYQKQRLARMYAGAISSDPLWGFII